jgi:hypothetical protein
MSYTEIYFMLQTYGFFIVLGILALLLVGLGVYAVVRKIKRKIKKNKEK